MPYGKKRSMFMFERMKINEIQRLRDEVAISLQTLNEMLYVVLLFPDVPDDASEGDLDAILQFAKLVIRWANQLIV